MRSDSMHRRLVAAATWIAIAATGCNSSLGGKPAAGGYSCGNVTIGHCYATGTVANHTTGFRTTVSVAGNILPGDGFVNNEFWLVNNSGNNGWIEIGYQVNAVERPKYFWAVLDPATGIFINHNIADIPADEVGRSVTLDIHQIGDGVFALSLQGTTTNFSTTVNVSLWPGNTGGHVNLGQELAGTKGAVASLATFSDNYVYDGAFHRRLAMDTDGIFENIDSPPFGGWLQQPASGTQGGTFVTYCCTK